MKFALLIITLLLTGCSLFGKKEVYGYDRNLVKKKVVEHVEDIRNCYNEGLAKKPDIDGKLKLGWEILGTGKVGKINIIQSLDPVVDQCIIGKLATWKFAKPPGNAVVRVTYPFEFDSKTAPPPPEEEAEEKDAE